LIYLLDFSLKLWTFLTHKLLRHKIADYFFQLYVKHFVKLAGKQGASGYSNSLKQKSTKSNRKAI